MDESLSVRTSGGLLTDDFIASLRQEAVSHPAVAPPTFALPNQRAPTAHELEETIATAWDLLLERWDAVRLAIDRMDITNVRNRWIIPLFTVLDYELQYQRSDVILEGGVLRFPISHRGWQGSHAPAVHTVTPEQPLDERDPRHPRQKSPHDMVQAFLNASRDDSWAIVTNGVSLRLLRDFPYVYTRGYVEFDLRTLFEQRSFRDFVALYRLLHASRFHPDAEGKLPLDLLFETSQATGVAIGGRLRQNVVRAIEELGNGFLDGELLANLKADERYCRQFYGEILRVIYRILFLLFAEQRGMMPGRDSIYVKEYSISALRELALNSMGSEDAHYDLWERLKVTFRMVHQGVPAHGIPAYDGALFDDGEGEGQIPLLQSLRCPNGRLLQAIRQLTLVERDGVLQRISYVDLGVRELGSVYESLLDYEPRVSEQEEEVEGRLIRANTFFLDPRGTSRKGSGSYYTREDLVEAVIDQSVHPVLEERLKAAGDDPNARERALLDLKIVDPACGSGAFLIAAMNYLGWQLASIRTGEPSPPEKEVRRARRDVLQHCIYGVDVNPMAVELAKVSLWIDASVKDEPLNFLDHHIKCGNSLVGALPHVLEEGIPNGAFEPTALDDKSIYRRLKRQNRLDRENRRQIRLFKESQEAAALIAERFDEIVRAPESDPRAVQEKRRRYKDLRQDPEYLRLLTQADLWTSAFFWDASTEANARLAPTDALYQEVRAGGQPHREVHEQVQQLATDHRFFHWHLEFPEVFSREDPGFDCVIGNPPWEKIKLEDVQFFAHRAPHVARAPNAAERQRLIYQLRNDHPALFAAYTAALRASDHLSRYLRTSGRFPLTAVGDINLYPLFAELARHLTRRSGRTGILVQSGIATDYTYRTFFQDVMDCNSLIAFFDFENREKLFPDMDTRNPKFCILVLGEAKDAPPRFGFYFSNPKQLSQEERIFTLTATDIASINPETKTCPIFRSRADAELTKKLYSTQAVFIDEEHDHNPWGVVFKTMFHMANDSHLFHTREELVARGGQLEGNQFTVSDGILLSLYEGKMIHQFDPNFATYDGQSDADIRNGKCRELTRDEKENGVRAIPRYWVREEDCKGRLPVIRNRYLCLRDITNATNERTIIAAMVPDAAFGHKVPLILTSYPDMEGLLLCNLNSMVLDYICRQKIGGTSLSFFILRQLPIIQPWQYSHWVSGVIGSVLKALDLTWHPDERLHLTSKLDAIYAHLYELTRDEMAYIMDQFPIVAKKDQERYGRYERKYAVLRYYDELEAEFGLQKSG